MSSIQPSHHTQASSIVARTTPERSLTALAAELRAVRRGTATITGHRAHYAQVCCDTVARLVEASVRVAVRRRICTNLIEIAAEIAEPTSAMWTAILDAAAVAEHACSVYWRVRKKSSPLHVVTTRLELALEHHPTPALALALLRQYRSYTLRHTVVMHGLGRLSPELVAAVLECDDDIIRDIAWTRRPRGRELARLVAAGERRLLERLEATDPSDPLACRPLDAIVDLTRATAWVADGTRVTQQTRGWGRRTLRAVARLARHHDVRACFNSDRRWRKCGLESWIVAACASYRLTAGDAAKVYRIGRPHSLNLARYPAWYGAPGVLGLVVAEKVSDALALEIARGLSAKEWRVSELALANRAVVRADPVLRRHLARSRDPRVQATLAEDEPVTTLGERLRRLIALDPARAVRAIAARVDDSVTVLTRGDVLPLLRDPDNATRVAAQTLVHKLQ